MGKKEVRKATALIIVVKAMVRVGLTDTIDCFTRFDVLYGCLLLTYLASTNIIASVASAQWNKWNANGELL